MLFFGYKYWIQIVVVLVKGVVFWSYIFHGVMHFFQERYTQHTKPWFSNPNFQKIRSSVLGVYKELEHITNSTVKKASFFWYFIARDDHEVYLVSLI